MTTNTFRFSGIVRAAAAALALALVPALSEAQTAPAKKASKPAPAAAASPAPAPEPRSSGTLPYSLNLAIGPSFESSTALKLRIEGTMVLKPIFPNSTFELALPPGGWSIMYPELTAALQTLSVCDTTSRRSIPATVPA